MTGTLYVCATPIGNLEDITLRVLRILREVDLIAAEDTRRTQKLLVHYDIRARVLSYHEHNEDTRTVELIRYLKDGRDIALVSDAGLPGFSDPGFRLIRACVSEGITATVLPGPSAAISALAISGLPTHSYVYEGFLPRRRPARRKRLSELSKLGRTIVVHESPRRVGVLLEDVAVVVGDVRVAVARELTKRFEEIVRGTASELHRRFAETPPRGEIVVVIGAPETQAVPDPEMLRAEAVELMDKGASKKEAVTQIARKQSVPKRVVYELVKDVHKR